jgi:hypothetical protein
MVITCNGCDKTFKHSHGLSRHRTSCLAAKEHTALLAQKRINLRKVRDTTKKGLGLLEDTDYNAQQQEVSVLNSIG